jgi:tetratricopeptide (TPR) repeat protein
MFEKAIQLDANFIQAYSGLARPHALMYWYHFDHTEERVSQCKQAADKAIQLGPDLPESHIALAIYYYHCKLDYESALEQLSHVLEKQPMNGEATEYVAYIKRRQGKLDENVAYLKKALEINPRSVEVTRNLGDTYFLMRNYIEGERFYKLAISFSPDYVSVYINPSSSLAFLYLSWEGNTRKAREVLEEVSKEIASPDGQNASHYLGCVISIYDKDFQGALKHVSLMPLEALDIQWNYVPKSQLYAQIYGLMNNKEKEREYCNEDRIYLENKIKAQPDDTRIWSALGIAYAGLGLKGKAIQAAAKATELLPVSQEFWRGTLRVKDLAQVYVMVGEYDKAFDEIEYLLSIPANLSVPLLKLDPVWAPLCSLPRFQKLVEKYQ